jgi:hypothetical protein
LTEDFSEYAGYFHHGLRVEIGIRMPNRDIFREWAIVQEYRADLIEVELSRDHLPESVKFELGSIVDVGVWIDEQVYTCNAIVIDKMSPISFLLRLLSTVTLKERREFFRLGVSIRLRYVKPAGMTGAEIKTEWQKRTELEHLKFQEGVSSYLQSPYIVSKWAHLKPSGPNLAWIESVAASATISGGGIRFLLPQKLAVDDKLNLELHLPLFPSRVVHAVAEVVHVMEPVRRHNVPEPLYPTGLRFIHLEERDRDLIIRFISAEQLAQLRKLSASLRYREGGRPVVKPPLTALQRRMRWVLAGLLLLGSLWLGYRYYQAYQERAEKNEIEETYGSELGKYRIKRHIIDQR